MTATHLLPPRRHYDRAVVTIDWDVIKQAALAGLFVLVPAIVVLTLVLDENSASIWIYIFGLILVFGFMTAGYGAGRIRSDTPMIHGAIAGLALVNRSPTQPAFAAIRVKNIAVPKCPEFRTATEPIPCSFAR